MTKLTCCPCGGQTPSFDCRCKCHNQMDCTYQEIVAYTWICDAVDEKTREIQWERFCKAYPELSRESCKHFWDRIQKTRWHHHHHPHHHHHEYGW